MKFNNEYGLEEPVGNEVIEVCEDCGKQIIQGDYYYEIWGYSFCEECMNEYKKEAELDV